ncbi:hypothetical protein H8A97_13005 [Bradyrhizobium sp. Arg62]|uniref:hypothetical protein n=1 Tax=Bradyrhizobium brasilense TaxID=1419277 RepID=UPI001E2E1BB2|nr:hypothetical protein [Bradyrhizobium brasilense]MCC8945992.1 hypothetical protein [Bradyrhizobium brasilense]
MKVGLSAAPAVRWLISSDSGVFDAVGSFIAGIAATDYVDVAGPPSQADISRFLRKLAQTVPLPCVRLRMRMVKNLTTDEPGVEVTCSDRDLEEIGRWQNVSALKRF